METKNSNLLEILRSVCEKTIGYDVKQMKYEDMGKEISNFISKATKGMYKTNGSNGLNSPVKIMKNDKFDPIRFDQLHIGDYVYSVYTKGIPMYISRYKIVDINEDSLDFPYRHWKNFKLVEEPLDDKNVKGFYNKILCCGGGLSEFTINVYDNYFGAYVKNWCQDRIYSDKNVAYHSLLKHLKKKMIKNAGKMKEAQRKLKLTSELYDAVLKDLEK